MWPIIEERHGKIFFGGTFTGTRLSSAALRMAVLDSERNVDKVATRNFSFSASRLASSSTDPSESFRSTISRFLTRRVLQMTSIVKIHAISGVYDESPHCYLLQIDEFKILLDLGWDEFFNPKPIKELSRLVSQVDVILLSYPDPLHLGAFPHLRHEIKCPVYATVPVYKMGQLFMYDLHQSHHNMEEFNIFSLDDVDEAFDMITQLKYNQTVPFKGKGQGISITPLPAGRIIGGTVRRITKDGEEDIIYAVEYRVIY